MLRGSGKSKDNSTIIWDEFHLSHETKVPRMIQRFKEATASTEGVLIKNGRGPIPITIPAHTNIVTFLRLMYMEHKSGKLYVKRVLSVYGTAKHLSGWEAILWGGGRTDKRKIKVVDVRKDSLPKTIQLLDLVSA